MKIILKEEVQGVGYEGDIAEVKDGYARNYLLPQGLAVKASGENLAKWEEEKEELKAKRDQAEEKALELKKVIEEKVIVITKKAGKEGRIFGSVTNQDVAQAFTEQTGEEIDRRKIVLEENIKDLGEETLTVKVFPKITAELRIRIQNEDGEIVSADDEEAAGQGANEPSEEGNEERVEKEINQDQAEEDVE